jgi:hypothetical protein
VGGMADEMARRMAEDGGSGLASGDSAGGSPGNQGESAQTGAPAAEPSTTDTAAGTGTPDSIPYARFKEVNDRLGQLKGFEELTSYGYDADSLRRLAAFEAGYLQDPLGTVATMAENLDLPQEVIEAIRSHAGDAGDGNGRAEGPENQGDGKTTELPPEVKERLDYVDQLRAREQEVAREAQLQAVVEAWDKLDKADEIETPEIIKYMAIAQTAASGRFDSYDDLAAAARAVINDFRGSVVGSAVSRTGRGGGAPPGLPGSPPAGAGPVKFSSIRDATKAAEAAIKRGELPPIVP